MATGRQLVDGLSGIAGLDASELLMALGTTHGSAMRDVLTGVVTSFEAGRSDVVPMFGDRTTNDGLDASAGSEQGSDAIDAVGEQGVGMAWLLNCVERRDASEAEAAADGWARPPS